MLKQIFVRTPIDRRAAGGASGLRRIALVACAVSLAGCVTSSDDVATGPPDFQTGPAVATGKASSGPASARTADLQPGTAGSAPKVVRPLGAPASAAKAGNYGYTVGPMDILEISVFKVPELSKSVQVADTGTINMPLLGEVPAAGKTAQEIEKDLTRKLGAQYLKNPQVTVYVKDHNSQLVTVEGAVNKPGLVPIPGKLSLVQVIAMSGGLNNDLYSKDITVFSTIDGERTSKVYNIDDIRAGKADDPELHKGDVVVVDNSAVKTTLNTTLRLLSPALQVGTTAAAIGD